MALSGDVDLYGKVKTFEIKGYNGNYSESYNDFNYLIPDTVTEIFFTDEIKPETTLNTKSKYGNYSFKVSDIYNGNVNGTLNSPHVFITYFSSSFRIHLG